jgi:SAM-dependent methyltransferase
MLDEYYQSPRAEMRDFLPERYSKTLEIGCGAAGFSATSLPGATERWGIEPNPAMAQIAAGRLDRVLNGIYDDVAAQLPDGYFDLIVCNDVIEHMIDHDSFFEAIKRKMAPGAVLIGSIPNIRHTTTLMKLLVLKDWSYNDHGILDRTHLRFFTEKSLRATLHRHGFRIERFHGLWSIVRHGIRGWKGPKNLAVRLIAALPIIATLGYWSDTQYVQFGFRATPER